MRIPTSPEVYAVLMTRHRDDLHIYSTNTQMDEGLIETAWGFNGAAGPILFARTTWENPADHYANTRENEKHEFFLCFQEEPQP